MKLTLHVPNCPRCRQAHPVTVGRGSVGLCPVTGGGLIVRMLAPAEGPVKVVALPTFAKNGPPVRRAAGAAVG